MPPANRRAGLARECYGVMATSELPRGLACRCRPVSGMRAAVTGEDCGWRVTLEAVGTGAQRLLYIVG